MKPATVKGRSKEPGGNIIANLNDNPIINLIVYNV